MTSRFVIFVVLVCFLVSQLQVRVFAQHSDVFERSTDIRGSRGRQGYPYGGPNGDNYLPPRRLGSDASGAALRLREALNAAISQQAIPDELLRIMAANLPLVGDCAVYFDKAYGCLGRGVNTLRSYRFQNRKNDEVTARERQNPAAQGNDAWSRAKREGDERMQRIRVNANNQQLEDANAAFAEARRFLDLAKSCISGGSQRGESGFPNTIANAGGSPVYIPPTGATPSTSIWQSSSSNKNSPSTDPSVFPSAPSYQPIQPILEPLVHKLPSPWAKQDDTILPISPGILNQNLNAQPLVSDSQYPPYEDWQKEPESDVPDAERFALNTPEDQILDKRLRLLLQSMTNKASKQISDPEKRKKFVQDLDAGCEGIELGVSEAKDEILRTGAAAFRIVVSGTDAFAKDPVNTIKVATDVATAFGAGLSDATTKYVSEVANDPNALDRNIDNAADGLNKFVDGYSELSPKEKGKMWGNFVAYDVAFGAVAKAAGQSKEVAKGLLKPHTDEIGKKLKAIVSSAKLEAEAAKSDFVTAARDWGQSAIPAYAGAGPSAPRGPPTSGLDSLFDKMTKVTSGGKAKKLFGDGSKIKEGWSLDGATADKLPWPEGWIKSRKGDFDILKGKLYLRPSAESIEKLSKIPFAKTNIKYKLKRGQLIPFHHGVPDFEQWSYGGNIAIPGLDGTAADFPKIHAFLAKQGWNGFNTSKAVAAEFNKLQITAHHFYTPKNGTKSIIQLVPSSLHDEFKHTGDAFKLRNR